MGTTKSTLLKIFRGDPNYPVKKTFKNK